MANFIPKFPIVPSLGMGDSFVDAALCCGREGEGLGMAVWIFECVRS